MRVLLALILLFNSFSFASAVKIYQAHLEILYVDHPSHPKKIYRAKFSDASFKNLILPEDFNLKHGTKFKFEADEVGDRLEVKKIISQTKKTRLIGSPAESNGAKKVLVVLVTDASFSETFIPYTNDEISDMFFGFNKSVAGYMKEASSSNMTLTGTLLGTLSVPNLCSSDNLFERGVEQTVINTVQNFVEDIDSFDFLSIVIPDRDECLEGAAGIGTLGRGIYDSNKGNIRMGVNFVRSYNREAFDDAFLSTAIHELGHNLGLNHANVSSCGTDLFSASACPGIEYGDGHSIMGTARSLAHFNMIHKQDLGWVAANEVLTIDNPSLVENINLLPVASTQSGIKMIRVKRNDGRYYSIEYRRPIGYDGIKERSFNTLNFGGFLVYLDEESIGNRPLMLDASFEDFRSSSELQGSSGDQHYVNFDVTDLMHDRGLFLSSRTFNDTVSDIVVSASSLGSDSATITVNKSSSGGDNGGGDNNQGDNSFGAFFIDVENLSRDIVLNSNKKTKIFLVVPKDDTKQNDFSRFKARRRKSLRKLVKIKKNRFNLFRGASIRMTLAPERIFRNRGLVRDSNGFYEIDIEIKEQGGPVTPLKLRVKSADI